MKNIITKIALTVFVCLAVSCSDFLDEKPLDSYTVDDIFTDIVLTESYVNQRYTEIEDGLGSVAMRFVCDEAYMTHSNGEAGAYFFNRGEVTPDQMGSYNIWSKYYKAIKNCNIYFQYIDKLDVSNSKDKEKAEKLSAEVTFIRAFLYAELVNRYGGVPIITKVFGLNDPEISQVTRASYNDCIKFIVDELDAAAAVLPTKHNDADWGRATRGAALALKSKMLLYAASPQWNTTNDIQKWKDAADAAWAVIDLKDDKGNKVYTLDDDYGSLFLSNKSKEIIFWKQFNREFGHYFDRNNTPNGYAGWSSTSVLQNFVDEYEMADGSMPDPSLYNGTNPWAGREPRFYASIIYDGCEFRDREVEFFLAEGKDGISGVDSQNSHKESWNATKSSYTIRKFMDEKTNFPSQKSGQPWVYSRLGEIYLNYAEAKFKMGEEGVAKEYINYIRERARGGDNTVLPNITAAGNDLWAKIQHERKIELAFENHRYFDVRRWKIAEQTEKETANKITITKDKAGVKKYKIEKLQDRNFIAPNNYLMPIPRGEVQKNPLIEQNPNYE